MNIGFFPGVVCDCLFFAFSSSSISRDQVRSLLGKLAFLPLLGNLIILLNNRIGLGLGTIEDIS